MEHQIIGEKVLRQQGPFRLIRRYIKGWHPELGVLHKGLSGPETIVEATVVRANHRVFVEAGTWVI